MNTLKTTTTFKEYYKILQKTTKADFIEKLKKAYDKGDNKYRGVEIAESSLRLFKFLNVIKKLLITLPHIC